MAFGHARSRLGAVLILELSLILGAYFALSAQDLRPELLIVDKGGATTRLIIESQPREAEVWLNGTLIGQSPYDSGNISPGLYRVSLRFRGYQDKNYDINAQAGKTYRVFWTFAPLKASISVRVEPAAARISLDGAPLLPGVFSLDSGAHSLVASAFGFGTLRRDFSLKPGEELDLSLVLEPVPFKLEGLTARRPNFDPRAAGLLGSCRLDFRASGPGWAELKIQADKDDAVVETVRFEPLTASSQSYLWRGRDAQGKPLADGLYRVSLLGPDCEPLVLGLRIDSRALHRSLPSVESLGAYGLCPAALILPSKGMEIQWGLGLGLGKDSSIRSLPAYVSLRLGLGHQLEMGLGAQASSPYGDLEPGAAALLSLKGSIADAQSLAISWYGLARLIAGQEDGLMYDSARGSGLALGISLSMTKGPLSIGISPEFSSSWDAAQALSLFSECALSMGLSQPRYGSWLSVKLGLGYQVPTQSLTFPARLNLDGRLHFGNTASTIGLAIGLLTDDMAHFDLSTTWPNLELSFGLLF